MLLRRTVFTLSSAFFVAFGSFAAAVVLAGCPGDDGTDPGEGGTDTLPPSTCAAGYLGDPSKPPIIELRALKADGTDVPLHDGDDLAVIFPPQGGRVAFVGVRATNLDGCGVQITGALRDPNSKQVRVDGRTVNLRREDDGWGTTGRGVSTNIEDSQAIGDYSNVPLCPNQWASQDVFDHPFEVEVVVQDRSKKKVSAKMTITPRCAEPGPKETACRCLCKEGYVLGEACGEDAGAPDASTDGARP
ncbi:hypothetical protein AKJ09_03293 [Labilithrix luteola]|uniref:Lipoprotein n=1 Tax=Labilithrix luteola TaxID=1391654 RepID=A0A0K1PU21_9BACT|nr:hypothetical protein [Labilithrix luteola]AKU96629.1 hypothetical protein AKJ09_03293 [Labilithrix luteola]